MRVKSVKNSGAELKVMEPLFLEPARERSFDKQPGIN